MDLSRIYLAVQDNNKGKNIQLLFDQIFDQYSDNVSAKFFFNHLHTTFSTNHKKAENTELFCEWLKWEVKRIQY